MQVKPALSVAYEIAERLRIYEVTPDPPERSVEPQGRIAAVRQLGAEQPANPRPEHGRRGKSGPEFDGLSWAVTT